MTENDKKFIGYALTECAKEGIKVVFLPRTKVKAEGGNCDGYFNDGDKELYVATKNSLKSWFPVFLHEFCHFRQWQTEEPLFTKISRNSELDNDIWDWIDGKEIPMARVKKSIHAYRRMELNCEKRAVKYIEEYSLSINKNIYIRSANVYVLFYGIIEETRKWYKNSPCDDRLFDLVPGAFIKNFKLPKGFKKRIKSVCY